MAKVIGLQYMTAIIAAIPDVPAFVLNDDGVPITVNLFANDVVPDPAAGAGQFEAPAYTGYAAQNFPPTDGAPYVYFDANTATWFIKLGTGFFFQPTNSTGLPVDVYGYFVKSNGSAILYAERFDEVFTFTTSDDGLEVNPVMGFPLNLFQ